MLTNWQRLEKVVAWTGLSVNAFALGLGLKRAENLYQIKRGNNGISKDLAEMITAKYPSINRLWLLTGIGEMFAEDSQRMSQSIPFYRSDMIGVLQSRSQFAPTGYVSVSLCANSRFAALNNSQAMSPEIPFGAMVFLREISVDAIRPGDVYVIMSKNFDGMRFVRRLPGASELRLVPCNEKDFDEVVVQAADVHGVYEVNGYLMTR